MLESVPGNEKELRDICSNIAGKNQTSSISMTVRKLSCQNIYWDETVLNHCLQAI